MRCQHEGWAPVTHITIKSKRYDLMTHFALLTDANITAATGAHWDSPTVDQDKHTVGHPTYNARLLAIVIVNSLTNEFLTNLIHCIPSKLRNDGTYL